MLKFKKIKSIKSTKIAEVFTLEAVKNHNYISNDIIHHNSGKDFISGIVFLLTIHRLLCLGDCRKYLGGIAPGDDITLLNVALNAKQAQGVFFSKLVGLLEHAGPKAFKKYGFNPKTDILNGIVKFPQNLQIVSGHSEEQSQEGYNILCGTMDEASAFKTDNELRNVGGRNKHSASGIYNVLRTSINTRFPHVGKLFVISYPRFKNDFTIQKYNEAENLSNVYRSFGSTWEINTSKKQEDFSKDYKRNPEQSRQFYECIPPDTSDPFIHDRAKIELMYSDHNIRCPVDPFGNYLPEFRGKPFQYTIGIDLSVSSDRLGFAMSHKERLDNGKEKYITDYLRTWKALPGKEIDLEQVYDEVIFLRTRGFQISKIFFDQFQSVSLRQRLQKQGFNVDILSIETKIEIWNFFKQLLYAEEWKTYYDPLLLSEVRGLTLLNGNRVDHAGSMSTKDLTDAVVRSLWALTGLQPGKGYFRLM